MLYRKLRAIVLVLFLFLPLSMPASADSGPKPTLTIVVENPPAEVYYLDLLAPEKFQGPNEQYKEYQDKKKLDLLRDYELSGWKPVLVTGSEIPITGDLEGKRRADGSMEHIFTYAGIPDTFRVILVTPDNELRISQEVTRKAFDTVYTYNYEDEGIADTGVIGIDAGVVQRLIAVQGEDAVRPIARQLAFTLPVTFVIEGLVLVLFRFSLKKNWKPFLFANLATQLLLTTLTGLAMYSGGMRGAFYVLLVIEVFILAGETLLYTCLLQGHTKKRRALYGITANIMSCGLVYLWLHLLSRL